MIRVAAFLMVGIMGVSALGRAVDNAFELALPEHRGQLRWSAEGFKVIQSSAKPGGHEIGIRGSDESGRLTFLAFLFLIPEQAPLSGAKCRDGALEEEKKTNSTLKVLSLADDAWPGKSVVSLVSYSAKNGNNRTVYSVRGFLAAADICGDPEVYSDAPIKADDRDIRGIFDSYEFDENYIPRFKDVFLYGQILYNAHLYKAAAPILEMALAKVGENSGADVKTMRRVVTDQAGMAYGMAGDIPRARAIFEKAVAEDPDYPMYYYNLACADAEEKNLARAQVHLQAAFDRKANVLPGESMPDPTTDDSFMPYRDNKDFWGFLASLDPKAVGH